MLSTAPVIVKMSTLHPLVIASWRLLLVAVFLLPFMLKAPSKKIPLKTLRNIFFISIILFFHFYAWFSGIPKLPIAFATIIYACNPISTAIISFLVLKEPLYPRHIIGMILSMSGIYITYQGSLDSLTNGFDGVLEIIFAAIAYSTYMVYSKKARLSIPNSIYSFYLNLFTSLIAFAALVVSFIFTDLQTSWIDFESSQWLILLALAVLPSLLGHTLIIYILPNFNMNFVSIFKLTNPLLAGAMAYVIFGEGFTLNHFIGLFFVAIGVTYSLGIKLNKLGSS